MVIKLTNCLQLITTLFVKWVDLYSKLHNDCKMCFIGGYKSVQTEDMLANLKMDWPLPVPSLDNLI